MIHFKRETVLIEKTSQKKHFKKFKSSEKKIELKNDLKIPIQKLLSFQSLKKI